MNRIFTFFCLILLSVFIFGKFSSVFASDTIVVQTLTFDDITKRRDIWKFPDNNDTYRKIIMKYRLKCDPRTTRDNYNCGEWDYLTYNTVYVHTGVLDSNKLTHPFFKLGRTAPDTVRYTSQPTSTIYHSVDYKAVIQETISENQFVIGDSSLQLALNGKKVRAQFLYDDKELKNLGAARDDIQRMKLYFKSTGTLKNFTVRMLNTNLKNLEDFESIGLTTVFSSDLEISTEGWQDIDFFTPFAWNGLFNILVEISYESDSGGEVLLSGHPGESIISNSEGSFLRFDGDNDYVYCGDINQLDGAQQFTLECRVRIDQWKNWEKILMKGPNIILETGNDPGEIYCIVRNPDNSHGHIGNAFQAGEWAQIAMVYDGSQTENSEKLKIYVNGKEKVMIYNLDIPDKTDDNDSPFTLSGVDNANDVLNGALDEVRVWDKALDAETIAEWMNKSLDDTHPDYSHLAAYYPMEEIDNQKVKDKSGNGYDGILLGIPGSETYAPENISYNPMLSAIRPDIDFIQGEYKIRIDSTVNETIVENPPASIIEYEISGNKPVFSNIIYAWLSGWNYTYDAYGNKTDSSYTNYENELVNYDLEYFSEPFEVLDPWEIGRFITPYGINLDLGPEGFEWEYDVTDYADLLKGDVDFSAGNNQELIDVKFLFIKGTPPRNVLKISRPWGAKSAYKYRDLSNDSKLSEVEVDLLPEASQFKLRARLTGHGHNSNDGNYPHCCEWKDNTHYFIVNGQQAASWHIWRYTECGMNPVYPQGGTWPGAREGWCPGDVVFNYDFEITNLITDDNVTLDYDITKVPQDNQGMGNGNYHTAVHLFQYGEPNFSNDCEIYDVITPNRWPYYSRINPSCTDPIIEVRNNGSEDVSNLTFKYGVSQQGQSEQTQETFNWTGTIKPNETKTIYLPVPGNEFWIGDERHLFTVILDNNDDYADNDTSVTSFEMPDLFNEKIVLQLQTNLRGANFTYRVLDVYGNEVFSRPNLGNAVLYNDTLNLPEGCYRLELIDQYSYGLSYWAFPDQGQGFLRILGLNGNILKNFNPDCGRGIFYSFRLGDVSYIEDTGFDNMLEIYPNPAGHILNMHISYDLGDSRFQLFDINGKLLMDEKVFVQNGYNRKLDINSLPAGGYIVRFISDKYDIKKQFVKK